jgi:DNA-binding IclR family transcriptional regulator
MISDMEDSRLLRTADRALAVLELVATSPVDLVVKDVAALLRFNLTTTYHLVNTLAARGYLVRDGRGRLRIGPKVAVLHQGFVGRLQPAVDLEPVLQRLSERTAETTYLSTWEQGDAVLQAVVEGPHPVRVTGLYVGLRGDSHCRASGKAVLAYLPPAELSDFLRTHRLTRRTPRTITGVRRLRAELTETAGRGWALDAEEFAVGVACMAAPYFGPDGRVQGALTVSAPVARLEEATERVRKAVLSAGEEASRLLGYSGPYPRIEARSALSGAAGADVVAEVS